MTKEEIEEGNKLIAEFMGGITTDSETWRSKDLRLVSKYEYHSSWDWLMPVVEKIELDHHKQFNTRNKSAWINGGTIFGTFDVNSKIEAMYKTVIQFIKLHKNQTTHK